MSVHQWELRQPPSKKQENKVKSQRAETKEASAREERVDIRVGTPKQHIEQLFTTTDYEPMILEHKTFMAHLCAHPVEVYTDMRRRLDTIGETASFQREFGGVVGFLTQYLFQPRGGENHCALWFSGKSIVRDQLIPALAGIQIKTRYMYPYRATLYVIQRMLSIIDQYHRSQTAVQLPEYYHNFRYEYYMTLLTDVDRNDIILMPTCSYVGSTVLIKLRCVPVHVLGVVCKPTYADQYVNSPLDFWSHDVNHARRTMLETERYYDTYVKHRTYFTKRNYWANVSKMIFYKEMESFTQGTLLPLFTPSKGARAIRNLTERSSEQQQFHKIEGYKALKKIIIFEITHEKAWPITPDSLLRNIVMGYDRFPVESLEVNDGIETRDFAFSDPTTLSNTIHKLRGGFYDNPNDVIAAIVPLEFRTSTHMAQAAEELFNEIADKFAPSVQRPSLGLLLSLTTDTHDTDEFRDLPGVNVEDIAPNQPAPKEEYTRPRPEDFIEGRI